MKKRIFSLVSVMVMLLSVVCIMTACGGDSDSDDNGSVVFTPLDVEFSFDFVIDGVVTTVTQDDFDVVHNVSMVDPKGESFDYYQGYKFEEIVTMLPLLKGKTITNFLPMGKDGFGAQAMSINNLEHAYLMVMECDTEFGTYTAIEGGPIVIDQAETNYITKVKNLEKIYVNQPVVAFEDNAGNPLDISYKTYNNDEVLTFCSKKGYTGYYQGITIDSIINNIDNASVFNGKTVEKIVFEAKDGTKEVVMSDLFTTAGLAVLDVEDVTGTNPTLLTDGDGPVRGVATNFDGVDADYDANADTSINIATKNVVKVVFYFAE